MSISRFIGNRTAMAAFALALVWSIGWRIVATSIELAVEEWLNLENMNGRVWTCARKTMDGFPFRVSYTCDELTLSFSSGDPSLRISIGGVSAVATALSPSTINASFRSPAVIRSQEFSLFSWTDASAVIALQGDSVNFVSVLLSALSGELRAPHLSTAFSASKVEIIGRTQFAKGVVGGSTTVDIAAKVDRAVSSSIDTFIGDVASMDATIAMSVKSAGNLEAAHLSTMADGWRWLNGEVELSGLRVTRGEVELMARGRIALDELHRPEGSIVLEARNIDAIAQKLGSPVIASVVTGLFGSRVSSGQPSAPNSITFQMRDGQVFAGFLPLPYRLRPVY